MLLGGNWYVISDFVPRSVRIIRKKCTCFPNGDVRDRRRERYNRVYVLSRVRTNRVSLYTVRSCDFVRYQLHLHPKCNFTECLTSCPGFPISHFPLSCNIKFHAFVIIRSINLSLFSLPLIVFRCFQAAEFLLKYDTCCWKVNFLISNANRLVKIPLFHCSLRRPGLRMRKCLCVRTYVRAFVCLCVCVCVKMKRKRQTNGKHDKRQSQAQ